jgi:L-cysteine:1D-myo-inositol 2-amino-2-deoxy-alpha-D-glucopyranoside ligase
VKSWIAPDIPRLPGQGLELRLFDTATQSIRPTAVGETASIYVCGITPYDATHMGHANTYVAFDILIRQWLDSGHSVNFVENVTDIDDPLLERAVATGQDWQVIAERETALFREDMFALRVIPPRHYIGAVESIPDVVSLVEQLQSQGDVYAINGDLYFRIARSPGFGSISRLSQIDMLTTFGERGGDPDRHDKENPLDPLLWQSEKPEEPAWDTSLGHGRPGWHIECSAIAIKYLGPSIDVQGGGSDLIFPHHEMSAAQAERLSGEVPFARFYVHSGMVSWQGHKMSKSRGNLVFVSSLRQQGIDPMAIRLALLAHHYRSDWAWTPHGLQGAEERLALWREAVGRDTTIPSDTVLERVREVLSDDLKTPSALDAIDFWARETVSGRGTVQQGGLLIRNLCDALLGVKL